METTYTIEGVKVTLIGLDNVTPDEPKHYVDYVKQRINVKLYSVEVIALPDGSVDINYEARGPKFERIRRITGYLTGDLASWNDAKRAEEHDRVKHDI